MTSQTVRVLTSFALLTLACQPAGAQPPVSDLERRIGEPARDVELGLPHRLSPRI